MSSAELEAGAALSLPDEAAWLAPESLHRLIVQGSLAQSRLCRLCPEGGRPSIPPEQLLLALLLQAIYSIRSERMLGRAAGLLTPSRSSVITRESSNLASALATAPSPPSPATAQTAGVLTS